MGATNCPETPRQKMISMMYLVYTALLALNVSVQILDGYKLVQDSLKSSMLISENSKLALDKSFDKELANNKAKFSGPKASYDEVNKSADETIKYIESIKKEIIKGIDGAESDTLSDGGLGELNIPSVIWKQKIATKGESKDGLLYEAVEKFRSVVEKAYGKDKESIADLNKTFEMKSKKTETGTRTWEARIFEDMPAIACLTMLTKTENDIRNTQVQVGKYLLGSADAEDVRVNKMEAIAVANTGYVLRGGKYEAKIILAAIDSTKKPDIYIGGNKLGEDGKYVVTCTSIGNKKYSGYISVKQKDGSEKKYDFSNEYTVGEPSATISPDMLNVVYAGYPNPMSVSVPGVSMSDVTVTFSNCSTTKKGDGTFVIVPHRPGGNCEVNVTAKIQGKVQKMGSKSFRILPLPPPLAFLKGPNGATFGGGNIKKGALMQATEVVAELNSDLLKNVKYTVLRFDMKSFDSMGNTVVLSSTSGRITDAMKAKMKSLAPGKTFYISGTVAKGPDGKQHKLPAVEVAIQ